MQRDLDEVWLRWQQGWTLGRIGRSMGRSTGVQAIVARTGGVRPPVRIRAADRLSLLEREEISCGVAAGDSARAMARRLGRSPSTVTRELARNGGRGSSYRAQRAEQQAWDRARRPKSCRLADNAELAEHIETGLDCQWSPEQIAG